MSGIKVLNQSKFSGRFCPIISRGPGNTSMGIPGSDWMHPWFFITYRCYFFGIIKLPTIQEERNGPVPDPACSKIAVSPGHYPSFPPDI